MVFRKKFTLKRGETNIMETPRRIRRIKLANVEISPQSEEVNRALKEALEQVVEYTSRKRWFISQYKMEQLNALEKVALKSISRLK